MNEDNKRGGGIGLIALALVALFILKHLGKIVGTLFWIALVVVGGGFLILLVALIFGGFKQGKNANKEGEGEAAPSLSEEQLAAIKKTKSTLSGIRIASADIRDETIRNSFTAICAKMDKILNTLKEDPEDYHAGHRVCTYYADAVKEIEKKYVKLQNSGIDISETTAKMKADLSEIDAALDKLYDSLFANDKLDLTVEMKSLAVALKRDGLVDDIKEIDA